MAGCALYALSAQSVGAADLSGYFRIQNAAGIADNKGYVQVRGAFTAQADQTYQQATTEAGTVFYLEANKTAKGTENLLQVTSLRSQGIEVVGEPIADYMKAVKDIIMTPEGTENQEEALWALVRGGFQHGYTSVGRAFLQTMIEIVATRLDSEGFSDKDAEELANFAERFNHEVADNIDLHIYLEPVGNTYRLLYDTPDLQCVSDWYLKDENKATFEKGFNAMRHYLTTKSGIGTGETLSADEIAEMQGWGYDPTEKHADLLKDGTLMTTYETIFADPDLLFNWLKLNMIKFTDENRCPQISLMGFYLPDFAVEMKKHALTAQLISYFPRLTTNQRVYLTDGKNGKFGHLDFTSVAGAEAIGDGAKWVLHPITAEDDSYLAFNYKGIDSEGYYASVYTDFPMRPADPQNTSFWTLSDETRKITISGLEYEYHELTQVENVEARTPVLIQMTTADASNHRILPVYSLSMPLPPAEGFLVGDEEIAVQRAKRRVADLGQESPFKGVLLDTQATTSEFKNKWGIDYDTESTPAHLLTTRNTTTGDNVLWYSRVAEGTKIPANEACLVKPTSVRHGFAVKPIEDAVITGIEGINADAEADGTLRIYNLQGVQVDSMESGQIYIVNGKKILVK